MRTSLFRLIASSLAALPFAVSCSPRTSPPPTPGEVAERLGRLAVPFLENAGQGDPRVAYYAPTFSGTVFVTGDGDLVYALPAPRRRAEAAEVREPASGWTLTESFVGGHPTPIGAHPAATHVSVFAGDDSSRWQRDVASYADVTLGTVWPGISVTLAAHGKQVEKVFTVAPGVAPDTIRVRVAGAESLAVADDGGLMLHTGVGDVRLTPPVAYQEIGGTRRMLSAQYALSGDEYGFRVSGYDPTLPVVIDPLLQATRLGGSGEDQAIGIAIGPAGDVYVAGDTESPNFAGTGAGAQPGFGGNRDAFVARLSSDLTALEQATFLGGSGLDQAIRLAIAPTTGEVYVVGLTSSPNFPGTSGGAQSRLGDVDLTDPLDGFVARLNASLTSLEQATYLGGSGNSDAAINVVIVPSTGTVYVAGVTNSVDFPGITGGAQTIPGGGQNDTFIARLNLSLTTLGQATLLGGTGEDRVRDMRIAPTSGDVYVAGRTSSIDFPGMAGGAQIALPGGVQGGFVARLNASLTTLRQATYLGGNSGGNEADALAIAPATGDVYVAGSTSAADFPGTAGGAQSVSGGIDPTSANNSTDTFVARLR